MTTPTAHEASALALTINGERRDVAAGTTLSALLSELSLDPRMVVVELNRAILRDRGAYPSIALESGDTLEIVHFVGGG